jgi:uncharacterized membrane-anchored protein
MVWAIGAFDGSEFSIFPADWQAAMPGTILSSTSIRVEEDQDTQSIKDKLEGWFVSESLAASRVLDSAAVIAGDYRMDENGNMRFALFVPPTTGRRRVGRIVQRLNEIEVYKTMSMLGLMRARALSVELNAVDTNLSALVADLADDQVSAEDNLNGLLQLSADLEGHSAAVAYRFSASKAYAAIVAQRIEVLRETQFEGRQTFREFMMRRFDPAMRTVQALDNRLQDLISRAIRTGDLLRTRVDVERQTQNQELLSSMNRRADVQLQLQRTVEGLSVVAISYYATGPVALCSDAFVGYYRRDQRCSDCRCCAFGRWIGLSRSAPNSQAHRAMSQMPLDLCKNAGPIAGMTDILSARQLLDHLVSFPTVSSDTNLPLIYFVRDYFAQHGNRQRGLSQ